MESIQLGIEREAESLLREYQKQCPERSIPPVPVDLIAKLIYGLSIIFQELEEEISGRLFIDRKILVVNKRDKVKRQRFTIAHELGHIRLHKGLNTGSKITPSIDRKQAKGTREREANAFAAALLMPRNLLQSHIIEKVQTLSMEDIKWNSNLAKQLPSLPPNFGPFKAIKNFYIRDKDNAFQEEDYLIFELLISVFLPTADRFQVSEDALWWRLNKLGLMETVLSVYGEKRKNL